MEKLKAKQIVKNWCEILGELSNDHCYFSTTIIKKLTAGKPFSVAELDEELHVPVRRIKKLISKRPTTHFDKDRCIRSHGGVSATETNIVIKSNEKTFYANSAWESLALSTILDVDLTITTKCDKSQEEIEIKVTPQGYETNNDDIMISFLPPAELTADKMVNIHEWSFFILGSENGEEWVEQHPDYLLIPLSIAYQSARDATEKTYHLDT